MLRQPLNKPVTRAATPFLPAPLLGVDESIAPQMHKPTNAIRIINGVSHTEGIQCRSGTRTWATIPNAVESLMHWSGKKWFACHSSGVHEVGSGWSSASLTGTFTTGRWIGANLSNPAGVFLVASNGFDGVRQFNGTAWMANAITGLDTPERLAYPTWHNRRIWFYLRGTLDLYYLDPSAMCGPAYVFPMKGVFDKGGEIASIMSLKTSNAENESARLVVLTSMGQVAIYDGHDPARSESFRKVGTWDTFKPIGWRPLSRIGANAVVITEYGLMEAPKSLSETEISRSADAFSVKIKDSYDVLSAFKLSPHWQVIEENEEHGSVILNCPDKNQWVFANGAWSQLREINATAWVHTDAALLFGTSDGKIKQYGVGYDDDGEPISGEVIHAFSSLGSQKLKTLNKVRPALTAAWIRPVFGAVDDYKEPGARYVPNMTADGNVTFNVPWGTPLDVQTKNRWDWRGVAGRGNALAMVFAWKTKSPLTYRGMTVQYTTGGNT